MEPSDEQLLNYGREENIAQRIEEEMKSRGWSQVKLAKEMAARGYPIHQSAISKIIRPPSGDNRRSVSVDEALGFAKTFNVDLVDLLVPDHLIKLKRSDQKFDLDVANGAGAASDLIQNELRLSRLVDYVVDACTDEERGAARVEALRLEHERLKPLIHSLDTSRASPNGDPDPFGRGKYDPEVGSEYYLDVPAGRFRFIQEVLNRLDKRTSQDGK